jgi:LDH2 family malate/lactate/ureidoglycolate dehydrogenase
MEKRIDAAELRARITRLYHSAGVPEADAQLIADSLVQADLWGHQSHGVLRTGWYLARLRSGVMKARTQPRLAVDAGAVAVMDGDDGIGQVLAAHAMREAIRRAQQHGIGAVAMRNSNHFGTCMYFTRIAAMQGCVAMLSTNGGPAMAPWGGRRKIVGTNPWSVAAPAGCHPPFLMDMANTGVARGKIYLARQRRERIPEGWAIDSAGRPTTDPQAAIDGIILPMAGHKGYAIAAAMDVLSGVLSGSAFLSGVHGPYKTENRSGAGHFVVAMSIAAFQPRAEFDARMERFIAELKAVPCAEGTEEIFYPGEIEARNDTRFRREGLLLPADTLADLEKLGY